MAAPGCRNYPLGSGRLEMCVNDAGTDGIVVRLSTGLSSRFNWKMRLQRKVNGVWKTIGNRDGYVSSTSASRREFSKVERRNADMRVVVDVNGTSYNSPTWKR